MKKSGTLVFLLVLLFGLAPTSGSRAEVGFQEYLLRLNLQFEQLRDYQCLYESFASNGQDSETFLYKLFFSKPKLIRLEIVRGRNQGTIMLWNPSRDKVRLRLGSGLLSALVLSMSPGNKKITDLNGHGIDHADWGWFLDQHLRQRAFLDSFDRGEEIFDGRKARVFELISKNMAQTRSIAREKIWIDPEWNVIVRYQLFDPRGRLVQAAAFTRIILNPGLDKDLFSKF